MCAIDSKTEVEFGLKKKKKREGERVKSPFPWMTGFEDKKSKSLPQIILAPLSP